jgi:tetratricopeptide (TPR) repeat protein
VNPPDAFEDEPSLDEHPLAGLADAILDGTPTDWTTVTPGGTYDEEFVHQLRVLAGVVALHRTPTGEEPAAPSSAPIGSWGHLRLLEKVGQGAFGDVYRAWDPRLSREVAVKLLTGPTATDAEQRNWVIHEARCLAAVRHPNVVTVHGADRVDGRVGFWTEFIHGQTLAAMVQERGPFSATAAMAIGIDLCRAVQAVHQAGLLHRDIKATNVMQEDDGRIVLLDFGTSRNFAEGLDAPSRSAYPTGATGTPLYLAPELWHGGTATPQSDLYGVGVILYYLVTGTYPVLGLTVGELGEAHRAGRHTPLASERPGLPALFVAVVERALNPDPAQRFESASALETALGLAQTPVGAASRPRRWWPRQHPRVAAVTLLALLGGVFSLAYLSVHRSAKGSVPFQARDWVLVTTFDNRTGDPQFNGTLEHALTYELSNSAYVNVVPPERVDDALRLMARPPTTVVDAAVGPELALRDGGIRLVLDGTVERVAAGYAMTVRIVEPRTGATIARDREEAPTAAAVPAAVRRLSNRIRVTLGEAPTTVMQDDQRLEKVTTPSLRALRIYSEAVHVFRLRRLAEAEALLKSALAEDPGFASAHLRMAWTLENLGRPHDAVIASARRAVDLVNTVTERERYPILGAYYWMTGQNVLATGQYEALAARYPDDDEGISNLRDLYNLAGRREDAEDLMVRMADTRPNDFAAHVRAAQVVLQSRGLDAARPQVTSAMRLLSTAPENSGDANLDLAKSWILMFPAHDLWVQGRAREASAVLDAVSSRPELSAEGDSAFVILGKLRLALGEVRLAESVYSRIRDPDLRSWDLSEVALARGDRQAVVARLSAYHGPELFAVSLLVRAGDPGAAERLLRRFSSPDPNNFAFPDQIQEERWAAEEIDEARGNTRQIAAALKAGVPWTRVMNGGAREFLYSETLARAAVQAGNAAGAIRVLGETGALGERAYPPRTQSGYYWMRTQKLLADVYRQTGQVDKARAIERALLAALAAADADYPLFVELKAKADDTTGSSTRAPH